MLRICIVGWKNDTSIKTCGSVLQALRMCRNVLDQHETSETIERSVIIARLQYSNISTMGWGASPGLQYDSGMTEEAVL